ncbi:unnamed protein product [Protopolystoma xenopodis]|uniref:Uncharacterized protein n=1 Tax=Protopolystoma xenopodis TaxID=117903 RepID=A0A448WJE0_9PLAT|nr:unnamed protein product [Protopolystoma xenopodis]
MPAIPDLLSSEAAGGKKKKGGAMQTISGKHKVI